MRKASNVKNNNMAKIQSIKFSFCTFQKITNLGWQTNGGFKYN